MKRGRGRGEEGGRKRSREKGREREGDSHAFEFGQLETSGFLVSK